MTFGEIFVEVLNSNMIYYLWVVVSFITIILGAFIIIGIKTTGRVILIDQIFKKKDFKREELNHKYMIQGIYTIVFGIVLSIFLFVVPYNGVTLFPILIGFAVLDFLYDVFAIKSSTKKGDSNE